MAQYATAGNICGGGDEARHERNVLRSHYETAGRDDPDTLAAQLVLLYDGAMVGAQLDNGAAPGRAGAAAAATLVDTAIGR